MKPDAHLVPLMPCMRMQGLALNLERDLKAETPAQPTDEANVSCVSKQLPILERYLFLGTNWNRVSPSSLYLCLRRGLPCTLSGTGGATKGRVPSV
eukprot:6176913-Pleurochrysis_carterae.AAC.4